MFLIHKEDKLIEETYEGLLPRPFNKNVMDRVREAGVIDYEVGIPIRLPLETEAVIMRCAHVEKLVTRVRPIPSGSSRVKPEGLDVVVIFLDATSRRAFHRRLRETEAVMEDAHARGVTSLYQFFRYNVVEFCTEPNTRAMFQSTTALQNATVPPVWEAFRASGYATLFTADTCQDLAAAYMNRNSSHNTSSFDHELFAPFCHADFFAEDANPFGNFKGPCSITARCFKSEQVHEHELRYLASLRGAYPDRATLSIGWFLEGHEGTTEVLRNLDGGLASYFRGVDWNSTAVIVAADHGLHMGLNFGVAQNGAVEHKNPFMAMMLPPWFVARRGRHQALHTNQQRVVTAFDLCKTLHALRVAGLDRDPWVDPGAQYRVLNTSMDLLHEEVLRIGPVKKLELALNGANACSIISMELT